MGVEACRVPSRVSNCAGEMVAESVLQQTVEEELVLEDVGAAEGRLQSPGGRKLLVAMKLNAPYCQEILEWTLTDLAVPGDRILAFHIASCPGPHSGVKWSRLKVLFNNRSRKCRDIHGFIIFDMASEHWRREPLKYVGASCEHEEYFEQLADSLGGFLDVYEELCNLRQIKLEIEIIPGVDAKKVLVEYARSHGTCTLILGSHKHFTVRRNKSLGRYCLRRLPYTCTVAVLERGDIILNEQGRPRTSTGAGMIKTLRRSLRSFGRRSKKAMKVRSEDDPPRSHSEPEHPELCRSDPGLEFTDHSTDFSDFSYPFQGFRHSFQGFSHSFQGLSNIMSPKVETKRADMLILEDTQAKSHDSFSSDSDEDLEVSRMSVATLDLDPEELLIPGWPLMHRAIGFDTERHSRSLPRLSSAEEPPSSPLVPDPSPLKYDPSPVKRPNSSPLKPDPSPVIHHKKSSSSPLRALFLEEEKSSEKLKPARSPLHRMFSLTKTLSFPNHLDRLKSPSRPPPTSMTFAEEVYAKLLQEIALDAFRSEETCSGASAEAAGSHELSVIEEKEENFVTKAGQGGNSSLALKLDQLCSDRKCITFLYEELEAGTSNFSSSNVVGRGGGSEVYKGKLPGGRLVAVKRLNGGPQAEEELLNDVGINTSLSHPHIVSLLGYCVDSSHLLLVYDYLPEGNLEDRLRAAPGTKAPVLSWRVRSKVAIGTAKALDYLHNGTSRPVIHRDVKSSNILLTSEFEPQDWQYDHLCLEIPLLSDFGLAKWAPKKASYLLCDDILGTFGYLAPEYFMYGRVNKKTDVYAFGVVLLELITGRTPIDTTKPKGQENLVNWARPLLEEKNLETLVDSRLKGVYDMDQMKRMLLAASLCVQQSPRRRPQMSQVLQILCSSHHGRLQTIRTSEESTDFSEEDTDSEGDERTEEEETDTPRFGRCTTDIQTHLALALWGVDDHDLIARSTALDHNTSVLGRFTTLVQ